MAKPWLITARVLLLAGSLVSLLHAADPALDGDVYISSGSPGSNFNFGVAAQKLIISSGNIALVQFDLSEFAGVRGDRRNVSEIPGARHNFSTTGGAGNTSTGSERDRTWWFLTPPRGRIRVSHALPTSGVEAGRSVPQ